MRYEEYIWEALVYQSLIYQYPLFKIIDDNAKIKNF